MKDTRGNRIATLAGALVLALTAGIESRLSFEKRAAHARAASFAAGEDLRDAVAEAAPPATAGLAGKPVPTSWFKTPEQRRAEMDSALLGSRRRRPHIRRVSLQ
jgi:hypothetical protein